MSDSHDVERDIYERLGRIDERLEQLEGVVEKVEAIDRDLQKYRGMVGGILIVVTALVTAIKMSWDWINTHWS